MNIFRPKLFDSLRTYSTKQLTQDIIAGIIVAIIALPLSIALAIASGVAPEKGLYTAIVAGFVIAFLGGSNVNISGPTAAFATIVAGIVAQFGTSGLVVATIMAGIILIIMGFCRFGALIKYIPYTITTGFTSGIALTILIGQLKDFFGLTFPEGTHAVETMEKLSAVFKSISTINWHGVLVGIIGLAILIIWPKISKKIPGSLIAVIAGVVMVKILPLEVNTIGDLYSITRELPTLSFPAFDFATVKQLIPSAFTIIAQGAGNIFSGLFGGIPATGAIARTAANVKNGGRTPISGIVHAIVLLLILVVLMPYAAWIPMPIIAAILFMVAYNMSEWRHFVDIVKTAPKSDIAVLLLTFVLTVVFDLVVAIEVGLLVTVVLFMKRMTDVTAIRTWVQGDKDLSDEGRLKTIPPKTQVFEIDGPMFFATSDKFANIPIKDDIRVIILRMRNIPALDISAMRTMVTFYEYCKKQNVTVIFSHANMQPLSVMKKAGFYDRVGAENFADNIDTALKKAEEIVME